jgi:hypothetical protein
VTITLPFSFKRLADGLERLLDGGVDEAAGIDHHQIGALVRRRDQIALGAQLGENLFGVDQRLRATQGNETDVFRL